MGVLDSMTDRYLADPLLSSEGRTGGGLRITLASIRAPLHNFAPITLLHTFSPPLHHPLMLMGRVARLVSAIMCELLFPSNCSRRP